MALSIITFADLGKRRNLKTIGIAPVIASLAARGELASIICRINGGFKVVPTIGAVPLLVHYALHLLQRISFGAISARRIEEDMLDRIGGYVLPSDTVLFHPEYFYQKSLFVARAAGMKTITIATMAHLQTNAAIEAEEYQLQNMAMKNAVYAPLLKHNPHLNEYDYVIALSDFVKDSYIRAGFPEDRIMVAYSDVELPPASQLASHDGQIFRVLYIAQTGMLKGLHYILDAWSGVQAPQKELVIVGSWKTMPRELQKRYRAAIDADPTIRMIGSLDRSELSEQYRSASVFVCPSLTEGNPKVVMEALSYGVPVITTEHARSVVVDGVNGFIIPIRDSRAFTQKMQFFADHPDAVRTMGAAGRNAVESKPSFGEQVADFYEHVVKHGIN